MSILASEVFTTVRSLLDDNNSGRYSEANDLVPSINMAIDYLVVIFNAAFEQKKLSPESLRELTAVVIVNTSGSGSTKKADVTSIMSSLWTILGVDPDPEITTSPDVLSMTNNRWAKRMTLEAWNDSSSDPFSAATLQNIPADFVRPGYIGPGKYFGDSVYHIMIRPASVFTEDKVAVWYLKNPTKVSSGSSSIELPRSLLGILTEKTLNFVSRQHSPDSKYLSATEADITRLVKLMIE
jgi:hypothetical protein